MVTLDLLVGGTVSLAACTLGWRDAGLCEIVCWGAVAGVPDRPLGPAASIQNLVRSNG